MLASTLETHQLEVFRAQLGVRAADLKRRLVTARDDAVTAAEADVHDTKDQSVAEAADEVRLAELERNRAELTDIELAVARIDVGTYGMCCDCGRRIGRKRLDAYPTAKRCHDCQESYEQRVRSAAGN